MEHTSTFAGVAAEDVAAQLADRDFLLAFGAEVGVTSGDVEQSERAGVLAAAMPWKFATDRDGIPVLAKKFLPGQVELDWSQEWGPVDEAPIPGTIHVTLHGTPSAEVTARAELRQDGADTVYRVRSKTRTSLPWPMGSTIEGTVDKELVGWILQVQSRVLRRRLQLAP